MTPLDILGRLINKEIAIIPKCEPTTATSRELEEIDSGKKKHRKSKKDKRKDPNMVIDLHFIGVRRKGTTHPVNTQTITAPDEPISSVDENSIQSITPHR